jgi:EAL domain-containing protein (putative c-di-GMP-specific phosphodiesterase class I)
MYRAKENGKARYELFETSAYAGVLERLRLESDLARAIEEGELRVYYQPKVLLETGGITDMEALMRWEHPERGLLRPAEFVPLVEETGLIIPIGQWILKEACRQVREWQQRYPGSSSVGLCVNLSARQLQHPTLLQDTSLILQETGFNPSDTESG